MAAGDNVLNKAAMRDLHNLTADLSSLADRVERVGRDVAALTALPAAMAEVRENMVKVTTTIGALEKRIEDEPLRCPLRQSLTEVTTLLPVLRETCNELKLEQARQRDVDNEMSTEVASLKSSLKWWTGGATGLAAIVTLVGNLFDNFLGRGAGPQP